MKIDKNNIIPEKENNINKATRLNKTKSLLVFKDFVPTSLADIIYNMTNTELRFNTYWLRKSGVMYRQITGGYRSAEDIYLIAKSYIPDITYTHVQKCLDCIGYYRNYCPDVKRVVYHYMWNHDLSKANKELDSKNLNIYL